MSESTFVKERIAPLLASIELDSLLDTITALNSDIKHSNTHYDTRSIEKWKKYKFDDVVTKLNEARVGLRDFTILKPLARGAFGEVKMIMDTIDAGLVRSIKGSDTEVSIAKCNIDGKIYALKKQRKADMLAMLEKANFMEEKLILCSDNPSPWLTQIHSAFQTEEAIYLAMEFMAGGDIMSLCIRADETNIIKLDEATVKFYVAEVVMALQALHERGWVHRDVKPENLLLDSTGHVKLADFGSCARLNERGLAYSAVAIGSPDYISPEILASEGTGVWHGIGVDVWSLGITLYEMLFGDVPFGGDTLLETNSKISQHQKHFKFSTEDKAKVSPECIDLLQQMITDKATRIGNVEGMGAVRRHSWFKGISWDTLRDTTPPFVPVLASPDDISNFDLAAMEDRSLMTSALSGKSNILAGSHLPFVGYSHTPHLKIGQIGSPAPASNTASTSQNMLEQKISALESDLMASKRTVELDKTKISELDASIASLESELRAAKRALDKEKISTEEIGKQRADSDREKMRMEVDVRDLKRKLHVETAEKEVLLGKVASLQSDLDSEKRKYKQLMTSIPDMEDSIAASEKRMELLKAQLADQAAVANGQEISLARLNREKADLQTEIAEALKSRESDVAQIEELTKNSSLAAETVELLRIAELQLEETQLKLFAREAELAAHQKGQSKEQDDARNKAEEDSQRDQTGVSTPVDHTRSVRSRTLSNNLADSRVSHSEQTIAQLKSQLLVAKSQLSDLTNTKAALETESTDAAAKMRSLNVENQQQQLKLLDLEQAQTVSTRTVENLKQNLATAEATLSSNAIEHERLNQDIRNLQMQLDSMRIELTNLTAEDIQKATQVRDLIIQLTQLEEHKRISEDDGLELMAKYQRACTQVDTLTERNIEMSNAESSLKTKIEELYSENSHINEKYDLELSKLNSQHEKDKLLLSGMVEKMTRELRIEPLPGDAAGPQSANNSVTSAKRYRFQKNVIQKNDSHLRDEISKRQDMEAELTTLKAAKLKLEQEFEEYRNNLSRDSPKSPSIQTVSSDTLSPKSASNNSLARGFFRPLKSTRKVKVENEIGPIMFSGWLKVRIHHAKSGGKNDWLKKYLCIRDGQVQIYDKEKDAETAIRCVGNVGLGNDVFLVRRAHPHEYIHNTPKEIACMFLLFANKSTHMQSKLSYSTTGEDQDSHDQRLGEDQLVELTEKLTKITDKLRIEEESRTNDEKLQSQSGTSKEEKSKAADRVKEADKTIKNLLRERVSYEQFAKNAGLDLEEMMRTVEHKAKLMQQKRKSLSHVQNGEQDLTDLYELNVAIAEWETDMRTIENFVTAVRTMSSRQDADNQTRLARDLSEAEHTVDIIRTVIKNAREKGRGSTQTRSLWNVERYVLRQWGTHTMVFREQQTGSLCNHCFNALFGVGQTLQCLECKFTCHKNCAKQESRPTCDEHKELSKLQPYVLLAADETNRQAWMDALETCHQTARYMPQTDRGESMISLYHSAHASTADLEANIRPRTGSSHMHQALNSPT